MSTNFDRHRRNLLNRNAVRSYHNQMAIGGVLEANNLFPFLEPEMSEQLLQDLAVRHRLMPVMIDPVRENAIAYVKKWLDTQFGILYFFAPNVGAMAADQSDFVKNFVYFSSLITQNILFTTPSMESSIMAHEFERRFYCSTW